MSFYWIYDISIFASYFIIISFFILLSVGGIFLLKSFVKRSWAGHDFNDQISFYLSAVGVFYGITLGLIAAGIWQNFNDADEKVNTEASALTGLYRDVSSFPKGKAEILKHQLKTYTLYVIEKAWVLHQNGVSKTEGTHILSDFQQTLYSFEPATKREEIIFAETLRQFNRLTELRRQRLQSVNQGMNFVVWIVIGIGAFLTIALCCLFNIPSLKLHIIMNTIVAIIIGSLIHLVVMLDNPFRGQVSIGPDSYAQVYEDLMKH